MMLKIIDVVTKRISMLRMARSMIICCSRMHLVRARILYELNSGRLPPKKKRPDGFGRFFEKLLVSNQNGTDSLPI